MEIKLGVTSEKRFSTNHIGTFEIKNQLLGFNDIEDVLKIVQKMIEKSDVIKIELEILR